MGTQLTTTSARMRDVPWLDAATAALVRSIVAEVARQHPDFRAAILFGSVARRDERPLSDPDPSDVDLFLLFDLEPELRSLPDERFMSIFRSIGRARDRHRHTPREVQVFIGVRDLVDWDPLFVENLTRDGIILWQRGPLPSSLHRLGSTTVGQSGR